MIYDVTIEPLAMTALIDLKADGLAGTSLLAKLGLANPAPGCRASSGAVEAYRVGAEHWLIRGPLAEEERLLATLASVYDAGVLIVPVADAYAFFELTGPAARDILAVASPLDADASTFANGGVTFTEAFGLKALVIRRDEGYEIAFDCSHAGMAAEYFRRINGDGGKPLCDP